MLGLAQTGVSTVDTPVFFSYKCSMSPNIYKPAGVTLRDPDDFPAMRQEIYDKVATSVKSAFPRTWGGVTVQLENVDYEEDKPFSPQDMKRALLEDKFVTRKLRGTVQLLDEKTGALLDKKENVTLMHVPVLTDRGTITHNGSNYMAINQMRVLPGMYGREMDNGNMEVWANTAPGTGPSWRVMLEPDTAQMKLRVGPSSQVHLYSVLRDMGVPDADLKKRWGEGTWKQNADNYNPKALGQAYSRLVAARNQVPNATREQQAEQIKEVLQRGQVLKRIVQRNMPFMFSSEKRAALQKDLAEDEPMDLHKAFQPDLAPDDMVESYNAIYGKHGPRLASMDAWPEKWINKDVDPQGWLEWFQNYHGGRRSDDDKRQIRRWLRMRRTHGKAFQEHPTPRRGYALRNWAIDPLKLLPDEQREKVRSDMQVYRDKAWENWAAKKAAFSKDDLVVLAQHLNQCQQAGIDLNSSKDTLEDQIRAALFGTPEAAYTLAANPQKKMAFLAPLVALSPGDYSVCELDGKLCVKHASGMATQIYESCL